MDHQTLWKRRHLGSLWTTTNRKHWQLKVREYFLHKKGLVACKCHWLTTLSPASRAISTGEKNGESAFSTAFSRNHLCRCRIIGPRMMAQFGPDINRRARGNKDLTRSRRAHPLAAASERSSAKVPPSLALAEDPASVLAGDPASSKMAGTGNPDSLPIQR
ncbi:hypothetical protein [Georgenia soli]|uniref:hypothetical protein n=1 Tax=Georgenia soli TaxID=638953 RepID=UPI00117BD59E|nr:hypothetical protein [Georgenia soli]